MSNYTAKLECNGIILAEVNSSSVDMVEHEINRYANEYSHKCNPRIIRNYKFNGKLK